MEGNKMEKDISEERENIPEKRERLTEKMRKNPWILSTLVLGILTLVLLVGNFSGGMTGNVISEKDAEQRLVDFAEFQGLDLNVVEVNDEISFYEIVFEVGGQKSVVYLTKDGGYMIQPTVSLDIEKDSSPSDQQSTQQGPVDWSVFENELPVDMKSKILFFTTEQSEEYDASMRINEFTNYDLIPKTLISFYGAGCGWCTKYHPVLVEAMEKYPEITIYALDLSGNRDIAEKYGATGTPANIINGKYFVSGYRSIEDLSEILDKLN